MDKDKHTYHIIIIVDADQGKFPADEYNKFVKRIEKKTETFKVI